MIKTKGRDFVAVVNVDRISNTYCQIIGQIDLGKGEEVHHFGWKACHSCFGKSRFITISVTVVHYFFCPIAKIGRNWQLPTYYEMDKFSFMVHGTLEFYVQTTMSRVPQQILDSFPMYHSHKSAHGSWDIAVCI